MPAVGVEAGVVKGDLIYGKAGGVRRGGKNRVVPLSIMLEMSPRWVALSSNCRHCIGSDGRHISYCQTKLWLPLVMSFLRNDKDRGSEEDEQQGCDSNKRNRSKQP